MKKITLMLIITTIALSCKTKEERSNEVLSKLETVFLENKEQLKNIIEILDNKVVLKQKYRIYDSRDSVPVEDLLNIISNYENKPQKIDFKLEKNIYFTNDSSNVFLVLSNDTISDLNSNGKHETIFDFAHNASFKFKSLQNYPQEFIDRLNNGKFSQNVIDYLQSDSYNENNITFWKENLNHFFKVDYVFDVKIILEINPKTIYDQNSKFGYESGAIYSKTDIYDLQDKTKLYTFYTLGTNDDKINIYDDSSISKRLSNNLLQNWVQQIKNQIDMLQHQ